MRARVILRAVALLLGAEVNAEAERSRELRRGEPAEVELQAPAKAKTAPEEMLSPAASSYRPAADGSG
jgi:hypothetical protein